MWSLWRAPNPLYRLKCESKVEIAEEWKVGACSLVRSTSGVEGHVGALKWGLERVTSINYSHGPTQNQTTSWLVHNLSTFRARTSHGQTRTHKIHHGSNLGETTIFPLIVYSMTSHETNIQMTFLPGLPSGSPEIPKLGTLVTLGAHNFVCRPPIEMRFEKRL
jgi:hypothetical protein